MKKIPLSQGKYALVDDADYELVSQYKWYYANGYAQRSEYMGGGRKNHKVKVQQMHRLILQDQNPEMIDHKNRDALDNRRSNLRVCCRTQNRRNAGPHRNSKTGVKGVIIEGSKYTATIYLNGKNKRLGSYETLEQATEVYNNAARRYFGEFAYINPIGVIQ